MGIDNRSLIQKADMAVSDLISDGGYLVAEQAKKFIRVMIEESKLLKMSTVVPMRSEKRLIETIKFGSRVLRAGTSGEALDEAKRSKVTTGKVELDTVLVKGEVRLPYEVLEDNIERQSLLDTIMQLLPERAALDAEELIVQGDTGSADDYLALLDGLLKQATSHTVDQSGVIDKTMLQNMLKDLPSEFRRDLKALRFFVTPNNELTYRASLAERATVVGDKFLEQDAPVMAFGVPIIPLSTLPGTGSTSALLTNPKNIHVGIHRNILIETDKDISAGEYIVVATMRLDAKFAVEDAVVKAFNITL